MKMFIFHLIPAIIINFIVQIILHETGHLIGGRTSGWKFLYIQVFNIVLLKTDKRLKLMIVKDKGYRCIMYPLSINQSAILYTMGGCIINLISGLLGLIFMIIVALLPIIWIYIWCFSVFGIGMFCINGTACIKRVCNDKACYKLLKSDNHTRICHNAQLITAKYLMKGLSYRDIGEEIICLCQESVNNDIQAYQAVLEFYYYLDNKNYLKMGQVLNKIRNKENISKEVLDIIEMENIYVRLLLAMVPNIKKVSDKKDSEKAFNINDIEQGIKEHENKGDIHSHRINTVFKAYKEYKSGDVLGALEILDKAIKLIETSNYVYEGERIFCIRQLEDIKRVFEVINKKGGTMFAM